MPRGVPTIIVILVAAAGLAFFAASMSGKGSAPGGPNAASGGGGVATSRPMPAGGWGPFKVMTANVRMDDPADGKNGWVNRRELLVKLFKKYQPEILGCQELAPAQAAYVNRELGTWYDHFPRNGVGASSRAATGSAGSGGGDGGAGGGRSALALLGAMVTETIASINTIYFRSDRFEVVDGESGMVMPEEPQGNATENVFFSLAVLKERRPDGDKQKNPPPPGTLIVVDVHFRHNEAFAARCAVRLKDKIAQWQTKYPRSGIVVMGDMNWDRGSKLWTALSADGPAGKLMDAFDYAKASAKGGSYHAFTGKASGAWPIDMIFFGGGLKVQTAAEMVKEKGGDGRYPSDHYMVEAWGEWGE